MTLTARPVRAAAIEEVGLAAEEGGDLQRVDGLGDRRALRALVHVGDHRQAEAVADFGEHRQRRLEPEAARARARGAVRLVERGLVDEPDLPPRRDLLQRLRDLERMGPALHLAGPGDQRERQVRAELRRERPAADLNDGVVAQSFRVQFVVAALFGARAAGLARAHVVRPGAPPGFRGRRVNASRL